MTRLRAANKARDLPASARVDLALDDNLNDDHREDIASNFGGDEYGKSGWGISEVIDELMTRSPQTVKVDSVAEMQRKLIEQGYASRDAEVDGVWSPFWSANARRWDRDNYDEHLSGKHIGSTPFQTALRHLGYMMPSGVWTGMVGAARGLVEQAGESVTRVGALGGAAAGAAIGTAIVPGAGTLIGGALGGIAGFVGDIVDDSDEEGEGDSGFLDALTPFEEYSSNGGFKKFAEDLGFVIAAASMIRGGAMAGSAIKGGSVAMGNVQGAAVKSMGLREALQSGAAQQGLISRGAASLVGKVSKEGAEGMTNWVARHGILAQSSRPLIKTINGTFTGLAAGQYGARLGGGLGSDKEDTAIEEAIRNTAELPGGEAIDTFAILLNPTQFLPFKAGRTASRIADVMDEGRLFAYDIAFDERVAAGGKRFLSRAQRRREILTRLGNGDPTDTATIAANDFRLRVDFGIDTKAHIAASKQAAEGTSFQSTYQKYRAKYKKEVLDEWDEGGPGEITNDLLSYSIGAEGEAMKGPTAFAGWLKNMEGTGSGLDRLGTQVKAERLLEGVMSDVEEGRRAISYGDEAAEGGVAVKTRVDKIANPDYELKEIELNQKLDRMEKMRSTLVDHPDFDKTAAQLAAMEGEVNALKGQLEEMPQFITSKRELNLLPANAPDAERGILGTTTDKVLDDVLTRWERAQEEFLTKHYLAREFPTQEAVLAARTARDEARDLLTEAQSRGLINQETFRTAWEGLGATGKAVDEDALGKVWGSISSWKAVVPKEVTVPDEIADELATLGKVAVASGEDVIRQSDIQKKFVANNLDMFAEKASLMETVSYYASSIGLSPTLHTNNALFKFRRANQGAEVHQSLLDDGVPLTGKQAMKRLADFMDDFNHGEGVVTFGPLSFAQREGGKVRPHLPLLDTRQIKPQDIVNALDLDKLAADKNVEDIAMNVYSALKRGAALGGDVDFRHPLDSARMLAKSLRVDGMPGFVDFMRTFSLNDPKGAAVAVGAYTGAMSEKEDGWLDALKGAAIGGGAGAVAGAGLKRLPKSHYAYLPDQLHRASMALRYTFSVAFDAGRYMEQASLGTARENLPFVLRKDRFIQKREWEVPGVGKLDGDEAWEYAKNLRDQIRGGGRQFELMDEVDRRMFQHGILGYAPRNQEAANAFLIHVRNPKLSHAQLEERITMLEGYGIGRRNVEKTANFFFFPFSFSKKMLTSLGDAVLQAPARAFLIHQGFKQFHEMGLDDKAGDFIEKYIPIANQLKRLNNLAYGVGPGRFFLQGYSDDEQTQHTDLGRAAFSLSQLFVPSGANTPLAQLFSGLGDSAVHLFSPVVVTDETKMEEVLDNVTRFAPAFKDIANFASGLKAQGEAITEGGDPYYQEQHYYDEKRLLEQEFLPTAKAFGYQTVAGFLESPVGMAMAADYETRKAEIESKFPLGARRAQEITATSNINDLMLDKLRRKEDRSTAEEQILRLAEIESQSKAMAEMTGLSANDFLSVTQQNIRQEAEKLSTNKEFLSYYSRFFEPVYGPLTRVA